MTRLFPFYPLFFGHAISVMMFELSVMPATKTKSPCRHFAHSAKRVRCVELFLMLLFRLAQNKIGKSIIRFVSIYVVNGFIGRKKPSKVLFHDNSMLVNVIASVVCVCWMILASNHYVTRGCDISSSFPMGGIDPKSSLVPARSTTLSRPQLFTATVTFGHNSKTINIIA